MDLSWFFQTGPIPADVIKGTYYNYPLVGLSYLIAVLASYVALDLAGRLRAEPNKLYWLLGGAFAMGAGIWSMHFIGMLAFIMPMPMKYDFSWTSASMLAAILASGFALFILRTEKLPIIYMALGGILLGVGIVTMHYMGMQGMTSHVNIHYLPGLFLLSILIAIVASEIALWMALQSNVGPFKRQLRLKIISALIMGAAIVGMHYTGMFAAVFTPLRGAHEAVVGIAPYGLAFYIAGITGLIIAVALIASTYKQLMVSAIRNEKDFLNALLNNLDDSILACNAKGAITVLNRALQKMLDLPKSNKSMGEWSEVCIFHEPNDEIPLPKENAPLARALRGDCLRAEELDLITKQVVIRNVVVDGQPITNAEGKKLGAVIAIHDVTDSKKMEQQLLQ